MSNSKFAQAVYEVTCQIKPGQIMTYSEVAVAIGRPKAARAVGTVLRANFNPHIPCHRVIRKDGNLGGYNRGLKNKRKLLIKEGFIKYE